LTGSTTTTRGKRVVASGNPETNNPATGAAFVGGKRGIDILHDPEYRNLV
jgi:hypothetical protein